MRSLANEGAAKPKRDSLRASPLKWVFERSDAIAKRDLCIQAKLGHGERVLCSAKGSSRAQLLYDGVLSGFCLLCLCLPCKSHSSDISPRLIFHPFILRPRPPLSIQRC